MSNSSPDSESLLTVAQAAQRLQVSVALVYRLARDREITHVRVGNGRGAIRFPPLEIDRYLRDREK